MNEHLRPSKRVGLPALVMAMGGALSPYISVSSADTLAEGTLNIRGTIGIEARAFTMRPAYDGQDSSLVQLSATAAVKASWASSDNSVVVDVAPFVRFDDTDSKRSHADLREAAINLYGPNVDIRLGVSKIYWGVTESRQIVDVVNQSDLIETPDGDEKLGQPMAMLRGRYEGVEATVVILPVFRPRTFPSASGRLRTALPIDTASTEYESGAETHRIDIASRLKARIDDFDIGVSYFNGTSREPRFELTGSNLAPVYDVIDQLGIDIQATLDDTLFKLEAITRDGDQGVSARRFSAVVAGVEHTISQVAETAWDVGLVFEFAWDDRPSSAPPTIYDKDFFVGARFSFNDAGDSSGLLGALFDPEKGSIYATIEASARIDDSMRIELEGALALRVSDEDSVLRQFRDDSFITVRFLHFL
jgi:hypothetical protein